MNILDMKKSDFKSLPRFDWENYNNKEIKFDSLIIIPTTHKHDSGYKCMEYCAVKNGEPIGIFGGESDVIYLDYINEYDKMLATGNHKTWKMDCLPCGYVHLWCNGYNLIASGCLSNFELYTKKKHGKM